MWEYLLTETLWVEAKEKLAYPGTDSTLENIAIQEEVKMELWFGYSNISQWEKEGRENKRNQHGYKWIFGQTTGDGEGQGGLAGYSP